MSIASKKKVKVKSYRFVSVLDKMIIKDLMKTLLAVLSIIVIIIVSRKFIKVLAKAIEGNIANETVLSILGLKTVVAIDAFLPASIFMAILMILGRMYKDNEMAAIASAGGGIEIYRSIFLLVLPLSIVAAGLSMIATPWAEAKMRVLLHEDQQVADIRGIAAGRFSEYSQGDLVFYTEHIDSKKRMHNVFVQNRADGRLGVVNAKYGEMKNLPGGLYLVLEQGERIQGIPGEMDFIIEKFAEYAVRIEKKATKINQKRDAKATEKLWQSDDLADIAEMQKRLSAPLGVLFLSFLAIPLAKLSPRGGIYASLLTAFAIYFVYGNLNRISYSWVVYEIIPSSLGYFWVYLLLFILGAVLLIRVYGTKWIVMMINSRGAM